MRTKTNRGKVVSSLRAAREARSFDEAEFAIAAAVMYHSGVDPQWCDFDQRQTSCRPIQGLSAERIRAAYRRGLAEWNKLQSK